MDGSTVMEEIDAPDEFHLLPVGGTREMGSHKGYGLGSVVDILANTLTGIGPGFLSNKTGYHMQAIRIDAFSDVDDFKSDMDSFLRGLSETPPAPGHERVVYSGLFEVEEERERRETGIPYDTEVIDCFRQIEKELRLDFTFT